MGLAAGGGVFQRRGLLPAAGQTGRRWQLASLRSAGLSFGSVLGTLAQGRCVPGLCVPRILQESAELATSAPGCAHVSMHTNLDMDSCRRARLAKAPCVPVTSILRFCPNAREFTLGKSSLSTCRHPGGWEGWQFRPTPSPVPSGQRSEWDSLGSGHAVRLHYPCLGSAQPLAPCSFSPQPGTVRPGTSQLSARGASCLTGLNG